MFQNFDSLHLFSKLFFDHYIFHYQLPIKWDTDRSEMVLIRGRRFPKFWELFPLLECIIFAATSAFGLLLALADPPLSFKSGVDFQIFLWISVASISAGIGVGMVYHSILLNAEDITFAMNEMMKFIQYLKYRKF